MGGEANGSRTAETPRKLQKSYFDVLGLCCSSEIPLVENILKPIDGVKDISVIIASRTVIVVHDGLLVSPTHIVNALNQARLEASVKACHGSDSRKQWPNPYTLASGVLLVLSFLKYVYHPLRWLALGAVAAGIFPVAWKGLMALRNLRIDINILVLVAVIGTIAMGDYLEAAMIVFLFSSAEWLESRASHKATAAMSTLMSVAPQKAIIAETGEEVGVDDVNLNTILAVKTGEVIPLDGIVVDGKCEVDEKTLTGESFPVAKHKDSVVLAGTINVNGYISVKTTALAEDCVVTKMAKLVEEAQNKKSTTQRFIDRCARIYTPAIMVLSIGIAVIPVAVHVHNPHHWFNLALVVLVSACPCALVLSTPVATFCALTNAAKSGLLIKGGDYLETLAKIKNLAFDKTGTITRGEFSVEEFRSIREDVSTEKLLYWVSSVESKSSHPMAAPLVGYAKSFSIEPRPEQVEDFLNFPGEGVYGKIDGRDVFIGNRRIAARAGCETGTAGATTEGRTIGHIFSGPTEVGIFSLSDACRTAAEEAIKKLKSLGLWTAMLTGDSQAAAMHTQNQLNHALDEVHAELLPEDKAKFITMLKQKGPTAMVGDGINDAPALATADIGISMGVSGSALATETGHVILMTNDVRKIPKAIVLAREAMRKVVENVILSVTTKVAILALAIAGHPYVWAAVLADVGTCLLVILNSMLLLRGGDHHHHHLHRKRCCKSPPAQQTGSICSDRKTDTLKDHHKCCSAGKDAKLCPVEQFHTESSSNNSKSSPDLHSHHGREGKHHDCHLKSKSCNRGKRASGVIQNGYPNPGTVEKCSKNHPSEDAHCDHRGAKFHESDLGHTRQCKGKEEEEEDGSHCEGHHRHVGGESKTHDIESGLYHAPSTSGRGCCIKECCRNNNDGVK